MIPVHEGIVKTNSKSFGPHCLDILKNQITAAILFWGGVIVELAVKQAKSFMMFDGHHTIFHAGVPGQFGPSPGSVLLRLEGPGQRFVLFRVKPFLFHGLFMTSEDAIKAPMN
jgi:hypothetical protein